LKSPSTPPTYAHLSTPLRHISVVVLALLAWALFAGLQKTQGASAQTQSRYYPQTGYSISGPFLSFFDKHGGLRIFGYPLTAVVQENGRPVQYFERQRFEYHSEYAGTENEVLLGRLGLDLAPRDALSTGTSSVASQGSAVYIPQTGHTLGAPFLAFWQANGGVRVFGYPISNVVVENGLKVQYFERARMEYHPDKVSVGFGVELGLLGTRLLQVNSSQANTRAVAPASRGGESSASAQSAASSSPALSAKENRLFSLINGARQQAGAQPVALDPQLRTIALSRSRDMVARNYFSHTTPDGVDFITMLKNNQVPFKFAGEIITNNSNDDAQAADVAFTSFMGSQHHHDIMLDPRYNTAGVGEETNSKGFHYFTVIFVQK
jgi:uncharacterized protein YkwD